MTYLSTFFTSHFVSTENARKQKPLTCVSLLTLVDLTYVVSGQVIDLPYLGLTRRFIVNIPQATPHSLASDQHSIVYHITQTTKVKVEATSLQTNNNNNDTTKENGTLKDTSRKIAYNQIGGLAEQVATVREMVETTLKNPELFIQYGNGCFLL